MTDQAYNIDLLATLGVPGAGKTRALLKPIEDAPRAVRAHFLAATREALRLDAAPVKLTRKPTVRARPPDGLRMKIEAAAKLGCSVKALDGYIKAGALRYVPLGHGTKRVRKMLADTDLNEFITNQTRKDSPCPSAATRARRSGSTDSKSEIVSFSEVQRGRRSAKPKR